MEDGVNYVSSIDRDIFIHLLKGEHFVWEGLPDYSQVVDLFVELSAKSELYGVPFEMRTTMLTGKSQDGTYHVQAQILPTELNVQRKKFGFKK